MEDKGTGDLRIAKVHPQCDRWIRASAAPCWNHDRIAQLRIHLCHAVYRHKEEMDLMNVEGMCFAAAVFNCPILNRTHRRRNRGRI